jgi:DNA-binding NarL/FixJ family response regulator/anti-sigma regulatory factor (Ser/Thr protein kinase)
VPDTPVHILLVEDSRSEALLFQETIAQSGPRQFAVVWVMSLAEAMEEIRRGTFHVLIVDLTLPDSQGLDTVQQVQAFAGELPVIVFTGMEDEGLAQQSLRHGAQDYLVKGKHDGPAVARAIRYAIDRKSAEEALRRAHGELEKRVQERTSELTQTVETLEGEVTRRVAAEELLQHRTVQLRALASELTLAEQRERRRMAEVLHDHLQQLLVGAKFRIRTLERIQDPALRRAALEVDNLITECIEISRSLTGELSPPILHEGGLVPALEWLARSMETKHGLQVVLSAPEEVNPRAEDISVLLFQSVRELLFNVVKHAQAKTAWVEVGQLDGMIQVLVRDEGVGFDPKGLRATGGSQGGFGLFSIRERLDLLGGRMDFESAPGKGSRFMLLAPMESESPSRGGAPKPAAAPAAAPHSQSAGQGNNGKKIRVLLADDHMIVRQGLAQLLRAEADMEVVGEAADGRAAVNLAHQTLPDVVIMDVSMPILNGVEATRLIHAQLPQVRVIGLSMFQEAERARAILEAGAVQYISKSGPSDLLVAAIRSCAKKARKPAPAPAQAKPKAAKHARPARPEKAARPAQR